MSIKKTLVCLLSAVALTVPMVGLVACDDSADNPPPISTVLDSIRLNSDPEQNIRVGDEDKIIYDAKADGKVVKNGVNFVSSDPSVITVDEYGNVEAVGVGTATVTLTLKNNDKITATVKYNVTKTFFMTKTGFCNGNVDLSTSELEGWVHINEGEQAQLLVSECSETWYFKTTIEHSGKTGQDSSGRWGIGSFLVDDSHDLGNTMMWFGFQPTHHASKTYTPYVGGWRVMSGGNDPEITLGEPIANASIAEFELIRNGIDHYCTVKVGNAVAKYVYSTPSLAGKPTYPGVYSQRQELYVSDYSVVTGDAVQEKLNNFQRAESVEIEGLSDKLLAGETYELRATVMPETTYDKNVTFALKTPVDGVSITKDGTLTVGENVTGEVTVVATATSGENVTQEKTYTVSAAGESEHELFDTRLILGADGAYTLGDNGVTVTGAQPLYVPLNEKSSKWAVSFKASAAQGNVGVYGIAPGYTNYVRATIKGGVMTYGAMGEERKLNYNAQSENNITVMRDGSFYYVVINGRLVERFYSATGKDTIPAIFADGACAITDVALVTGEAVDTEIAKYPFTVGKHVTDNGDGSYTIKKMNFGDKGDINWPPVNNYENGLKFANTVKGDFTLQFTLSAVDLLPVNGKIDSKILIYLKSESKTASLQFLFKSDSSTMPENGGEKFCANLNDATWDEYNSINLLREDPVTLKIVKKADVVEVYVIEKDGTIRVFKDCPGLINLGYWDENTECTPGIGTFNCGVTVRDVSLTVGGETSAE